MEGGIENGKNGVAGLRDAEIKTDRKRKTKRRGRLT